MFEKFVLIEIINGRNLLRGVSFNNVSAEFYGTVLCRWAPGSAGLR
jgi:hypothetical protein